ncbi:C-type natriuretic peptide 2-like [Nelusetta ayraudi]|uniref:C-type natriuretic peptide 2-like n=1 Tax=Nelusetta ayraudi TaxID=303726 RepID=UPI003F6FA6A9
MAGLLCTSSWVLLLIFWLACAVEMRPSVTQDDLKVLDSLFGSHLSSLILAPATTDEAAEGSARPHHSSSSSLIRGPAAGRSATRELPGKKGAVPQFFLDFLKRQSKIRRRGRTSMVGGRGCFGMKMDRIGSISGLGC